MSHSSLTAQELAASGATPLFVVIDGRTAGLIGVADTLKPESPEAVAQLEALGLEVWMLTGDNRATAGASARDVVVLADGASDFAHLHGEATPAAGAAGHAAQGSAPATYGPEISTHHTFPRRPL